MNSAAFLSFDAANILGISVLDYVGYEAVKAFLCFFVALDVIREGEGQKSNATDTVLIGQ